MLSTIPEFDLCQLQEEVLDVPILNGELGVTTSNVLEEDDCPTDTFGLDDQQEPQQPQQQQQQPHQQHGNNHNNDHIMSILTSRMDAERSNRDDIVDDLDSQNTESVVRGVIFSRSVRSSFACIYLAHFVRPTTRQTMSASTLVSSKTCEIPRLPLPQDEQIFGKNIIYSYKSSMTVQKGNKTSDNNSVKGRKYRACIQDVGRQTPEDGERYEELDDETDCLVEEAGDDTIEPLMVRIQFDSNDSNTVAQLRSFVRRFCKVGDFLTVLNHSRVNINSSTVTIVDGESKILQEQSEVQHIQQQLQVTGPSRSSSPSSPSGVERKLIDVVPSSCRNDTTTNNSNFSAKTVFYEPSCNTIPSLQMMHNEQPLQHQQPYMRKLVVHVSSLLDAPKVLFIPSYSKQYWNMTRCQEWQKRFLPNSAISQSVCPSPLALTSPPSQSICQKSYGCKNGYTKRNEQSNNRHHSLADGSCTSTNEDGPCSHHGGGGLGLSKRVQGQYVCNFVIHMIARKIEVSENSIMVSPMPHQKTQSHDYTSSVLGDPSTWAERDVRSTILATSNGSSTSSTDSSVIEKDGIHHSMHVDNERIMLTRRANLLLKAIKALNHPHCGGIHNSTSNNNNVPNSQDNTTDNHDNHCNGDADEAATDGAVSLDTIISSKRDIRGCSKECSCSGGGVIDAAGGSGHISMALGLAGVRSTVVDPREHVGRLPGRDRKVWYRALRQQHELQRDTDHSNHVTSSHLYKSKTLVVAEMQNYHNFSYCQPVEHIPIQPFRTIRAWFGVPPDGVDASFRTPDQQNVSVGIVANIVPSTAADSTSNINKTNHVNNNCKLLLEDNASAIVALHPDEATDAIVDVAVKKGIPFCIVPCCVFFRLFPHRRKRRAMITYNGSNQLTHSSTNFDSSKFNSTVIQDEGAIVSTHADLLDYLQEKHPTIQRTKLPFPGANTILWSYF